VTGRGGAAKRRSGEAATRRRGDAATRRIGEWAHRRNGKQPDSEFYLPIPRDHKQTSSPESPYYVGQEGTKTEEFSQKLTKRTKGCRMLSQIQA
jgi:hypothetical protein